MILALLVSFLFITESYAADPFTIMAVVGASTRALQTVSEVSGEISNTADAFNELYAEIDSSSQISEEGNRIISEINDLEQLAYETGYTRDEIESLIAEDRSHIKKISEQLRAMTRAVRTAKRTGRLLTRIKEKAQLSQIESTQIEREQLALLHKSIRLQYESNLRSIKEKLKADIENRRQSNALFQELKNNGIRQFNHAYILTFPQGKKLIEKAISASKKYRNHCFSLIILIFFIRVVYYHFALSKSEEYVDLIRDTIVASLLLFSFPDLLRIIFSVSDGFSKLLFDHKTIDIPDIPKELPQIGSNTPSSIKLMLFHALAWIKFVAFQIAEFLTTFGIGILILVVPIIIVLGQMLNLTIAVGLIFGSIIVLSLWPLLWNLIGYTITLIHIPKSNGTLGPSEYISSILFTVVQVLSPLITVKLFSGQQVARAVTSSVSTVFNPATALSQASIRAWKTFSKSAFNSAFGKESTTPEANKVSHYAGVLTGYVSNQLISRSINGIRAFKTPIQNYETSDNTKNRFLRGFLLNQNPNDSSNNGIIRDSLMSLKIRPLTNDRNVGPMSLEIRSSGTKNNKKQYFAKSSKNGNLDCLTLNQKTNPENNPFRGVM